MKGPCDVIVAEEKTLLEHPQGTREKGTFLILSTAGPHRDLSIDTREQAFWDEHAAFIDGLVDRGFIMMGGPLDDEGGAVLIVHADDEDEARETMKNDPWYREGILDLVSIKRWRIFIDQRA